MSPRQVEAKIKFEGDEEMMPLGDLGNYLYHTKAIYTYFQRLMDEESRFPQAMLYEHLERGFEDIDYFDENRTTIIGDFADYGVFTGLRGNKYQYVRQDLGDQDVFISDIRKESPFDITVVGDQVLLYVILVTLRDFEYKKVVEEPGGTRKEVSLRITVPGNIGSVLEAIKDLWGFR